MDLRQLRYFVAVADELHFTRAAARLHLAQSALSTQIGALEREVGSALFARANRRVELTPLGATLLPRARALLADADRLLAEARAGAQQLAQTLPIGCLGAVPGDLLSSVLAEMERAWPHATFDVHTFDFTDIRESLVEGHVDIAFLYLPYDEQELSGLDVVPVMDEPRTVVMSSSHPLAGRASVTPADLADELFLSHSSAVSETWRDFWLLTEELGRRPRVHPRGADTPEEWLQRIKHGEGIDTCPTLISRYYPWPGLRYVPLVDARPATLAVVRRRDADDPLASAFVRTARRIGVREFATSPRASAALPPAA